MTAWLPDKDPPGDELASARGILIGCAIAALLWAAACTLAARLATGT